jgi:FkbM family methyltransferase
MRRILLAVGFARAIGALAPNWRGRLRNTWVTLELTARHRLGRGGALRRLEVEENGERLDLLVEDISDVHAVSGVFVERSYALPARAAGALSGGDGVIVDLGSHIGASVAWFRAHFPEVPIVGFEPNPHSFRKLASVASGLHGVEVHEAAVAECDGRRVLTSWPNRRIGASLRDQSGPESWEVECVTLDEGCARAEIDRVDLLKLDIEGCEVEVLRSFEGLGGVRVVVGEYHESVLGERGQLDAALPGFDLEWIEQPHGDPLFVGVNNRVS